MSELDWTSDEIEQVPAQLTQERTARDALLRRKDVLLDDYSDTELVELAERSDLDPVILDVIRRELEARNRAMRVGPGHVRTRLLKLIAARQGATDKQRERGCAEEPQRGEHASAAGDLVVLEDGTRLLLEDTPTEHLQVTENAPVHVAAPGEALFERATGLRVGDTVLLLCGRRETVTRIVKKYGLPCATAAPQPPPQDAPTDTGIKPETAPMRKAQPKDTFPEAYRTWDGRVTVGSLVRLNGGRCVYVQGKGGALPLAIVQNPNAQVVPLSCAGRYLGRMVADRVKMSNGTQREIVEIVHRFGQPREEKSPELPYVDARPPPPIPAVEATPTASTATGVELPLIPRKRHEPPQPVVQQPKPRKSGLVARLKWLLGI